MADTFDPFDADHMYIFNLKTAAHEKVRAIYYRTLHETRRLPAEICWAIADLVAEYRTTPAWYADYGYVPLYSYPDEINTLDLFLHARKSGVIMQCPDCKVWRVCTPCPPCTLAAYDLKVDRARARLEEMRFGLYYSE